MQQQIDSPPSPQEYVSGFADVLAAASRRCPSCGGELKGHGCRHRWVVSLEGILRVPIQRLICKACRRTVSLLPGILYAFQSCTRALVTRIRSLWEPGVRKMAAVRYALSSDGFPSGFPLSTLYRWAGHTD